MLSIIIRPFEPQNQNAARQLILTGLGEHFGFIDETCNPDLDDIVANYIEPGHTFIVAEIEAKLVGTGALITEREGTGRLVRMSVSREYRRKRIGRALVAYLLDIARQQGFTQVVVTTEPDWEDAIRLYKHCGFTEYKRNDVAVYFSLEV